jgi:hypothetical protein
MIIDKGRKLSRAPPKLQVISGDEPEELVGFQLPAQVAGLFCLHARLCKREI